ncbi:hypothetical protein [Chitinivorax sp. B]|uniref:hypothetical protein n=1 Tax=Chitinivorax sp. B TaxID=2502235 RepID=UPI0010F8AA11|nr:hypothetical protein [Chitinivorax sp. B]
MKSAIHPRVKPRQAGGLLLVVAVMLGVIAATVMVTKLNDVLKRTRESVRHTAMLGAYRQLLLNASTTWGEDDSTFTPGRLLSPDRNFNGSAEVNCLQSTSPTGLPARNVWDAGSGSANTTVLCIGLLPWRDLQVGSSFDPSAFVMGDIPLLAISGNLVDAVGVQKLNSDAMLGSPVHKWLTVVDANGQVLSNQVAMVLIHPGKALSGQVRVNPLPVQLTRQVLNTYVERLPGVADHTDLSGRFTLAGIQRNTAGDVVFNDRIVYVTAKEWMTYALTRVAAEIRLAADAAYSAGYPVTPPSIGTPWFVDNDWNNWGSVTHYAATGDTITLTFARCNATWTIQRQGGRGNVTRQGVC